MADVFDANKLKGLILALVTGVIMIVAGAIGANMTFGFGQYVLSTVNASLQNQLQPLVPASNIAIVGVAIMLAGIVVVIVAVSAMIYYLLNMIKTE